MRPWRFSDMRAARLISLLLLLQNRQGMTAAELARELEVSERTVGRDVLALSEAGVPIYADRGRAGGYRLLDGYRSQLTGLARAEAEALFLSGLPGPVQDMGLSEAAVSARLKVSAALPTSMSDAAASTAQRFHLDAPAWFRDAAPPPPLAAVAEAVWRDRAIHANYQRGEETVTRRLEPYGLVLKAGVWYVVAHAGSGLRVYRVDRFSDVVVTADEFARPADFDLEKFWTARSIEFERSLLRERAKIRVSPRALRRLPKLIEPAAVEEALDSASPPDDEGWTTLSLPVESWEVGFHQLLRLGADVEVLEPPELRVRMSETAQAVLDRYQR